MDQFELTEFFGVLPKVDEEDCCFSFRVEKEKSVLEIEFNFSIGFSLRLYNGLDRQPLFSTGFEGETKIERWTHGNYDCLELNVPFSGRFGEADWNHSYTIRIFIEPKISVNILN